MLTVHGIDQDGKRLWLTLEYHELGFLSWLLVCSPVLSGWRHVPKLTTRQGYFGKPCWVPSPPDLGVNFCDVHQGEVEPMKKRQCHSFSGVYSFSHMFCPFYPQTLWITCLLVSASDIKRGCGRFPWTALLCLPTLLAVHFRADCTQR